MSEAIPEHLLEHVAARFRVLGDATRLAILRALLQHGELSVGQVAERLGAGQANISKHLRLLHEAHMVARRQEGTTVFYRVVDPSITALCDIVCDRLRDDAEATIRAFAAP